MAQKNLQKIFRKNSRILLSKPSPEGIDIFQSITVLNPSVIIITCKTIEKKGLSERVQYYSNSGTYRVSCMLMLSCMIVDDMFLFYKQIVIFLCYSRLDH